METTSDYYATLRVRSDVDDASLRLAYRKLMRRYHPDVNADDAGGDKCQAINEAYACLRDPSKRADYDARRRAQRRARQSHSFSSPGPYQPNWRAHFAHRLDEDDDIKGRGWKAAGIGVAIALTVATFAATSAVDRPDSPPPKVHTVVLKANPQP